MRMLEINLFTTINDTIGKINKTLTLNFKKYIPRNLDSFSRSLKVKPLYSRMWIKCKHIRQLRRLTGNWPRQWILSARRVPSLLRALYFLNNNNNNSMHILIYICAGFISSHLIIVQYIWSPLSFSANTYV